MSKYEEENGALTKFAVWRDPVDRIVSTYSLFCIEREYRPYFYFLGLLNNASFDEFMNFLEYEWSKKSPLWQDEHIRRQVDYYSNSDVDYIVNISRLDNFLKEMNVPFVKERSNSTNTNFKITNQNYIDRISHYYKDDYEIKCNY